MEEIEGKTCILLRLDDSVSEIGFGRLSLKFVYNIKETDVYNKKI